MAGSTRWFKLSLILVCSVLTFSAAGQDVHSGNSYSDSRVELYGGYGYFRPVADSGINGYRYPEVYSPNATFSVSDYLNRYFGLQLEGTYVSGQQDKPYGTCQAESCSQLIYTAEAGPALRLPLGSISPFMHLLGGGERTNGPANQSLAWGWGVTGGVGVDITLSALDHHLAVRLIQADYQYSQVNHGVLQLPEGTNGGTGDIHALKLSGGVVVRLGDLERPYPLMLGCGASPVSVYPGDSVTVTSQERFNNTQKTPVYTWTSTGGVVTAGGPGATIDTTGVAPGAYVATGQVVEGSHANHRATCIAPFTIKAFEPPSISCAATPTIGLSGTNFAITATAESIPKRSLTYSYTSTAGVVTGAGPSATLSTAGLSTSTVTVTCTVADDVSHIASATTSVVVTVLPAPVIPQTEQLCAISFVRDKKRPVRIDNEAKACLDDIALSMNKQTDARLVLTGNALPGDKPDAAAERSLNARQYLIREKGIDPSRIDLRIGDVTDKSVTTTLVPSGGTFSETGTHTFDDKTVVRHGQAYGVHNTNKSTSSIPQ